MNNKKTMGPVYFLDEALEVAREKYGEGVAQQIAAAPEVFEADTIEDGVIRSVKAIPVSALQRIMLAHFNQPSLPGL